MGSEIKKMAKTIKGLEEEVGYLQGENRDLRSSLDVADGFVEKGKIERIYLEGQLTVLKRMSGLYQEERMTHEEWMQRSKEILSETPLPF